MKPKIPPTVPPGFKIIFLKIICTVVGDYINIIKTTFYLNFDLYQAFKQQGYTKTWEQKEAVNFKKLFNNSNLNKKVVFIILI